MKRNRLHDIIIKEISLVDEPASPDARVDIWKSADGKGPDDDEVLVTMIKAMADGDAETFEGAMKEIEERKAFSDRMRAIWDAYDAFTRSLRSISEHGKDKGKLMRASAEAFCSAIKEISSQLVGKAEVGGFPAIEDAANEAAASIMEWVMDNDTVQKALDDAEAKIDSLTGEVEQAKAAVEKNKAIIAEKDAEIAKLKAGTSGESDEEVWKSALPASARERIEKMEADSKAAAERIEKMNREKVEGEAIAKARGFGFGDADKVGPMLVRIEKGEATKEDADAIAELLAKAGNIAKNSKLMTSFGDSATSEFEGDPEAIVKAKQDEFRKADPSLTAEQAYAKALDAIPGAYAEIEKRRAAA